MPCTFSVSSARSYETNTSYEDDTISAKDPIMKGRSVVIQRTSYGGAGSPNKMSRSMSYGNQVFGSICFMFGLHLTTRLLLTPRLFYHRSSISGQLHSTSYHSRIEPEPMLLPTTDMDPVPVMKGICFLLQLADWSICVFLVLIQ